MIGNKIAENEEKHAKAMTDAYFSDQILIKEVFRNLGTGEITKSVIGVTGIADIPEEEYGNTVRMYNFAMKTSGFDALFLGMVHAVPFYDTILEMMPEELIGNYNDIRTVANATRHLDDVREGVRVLNDVAERMQQRGMTQEIDNKLFGE